MAATRCNKFVMFMPMANLSIPLTLIIPRAFQSILDADDAGEAPNNKSLDVPEGAADAHCAATSHATGDDAKALFNLVDCSAEPTGNADVPSAPHCG